MENQNESSNNSWNLSLLNTRYMFGDSLMMKKKLITALAVACLTTGVGCTTQSTSTSGSEIAVVEEKEGVFESAKKDVALKLMKFAANKSIGSVDNAKYSIVEDKELKGYKLNVTVKGLHAGLNTNVDGLDEAVDKAVAACEKTSSAMEKLLESVRISDSNFQVNIVDDTDNSIILYSATNGETTLNELSK